MAMINRPFDPQVKEKKKKRSQKLAAAEEPEKVRMPSACCESGFCRCAEAAAAEKPKKRKHAAIADAEVD